MGITTPTFIASPPALTYAPSARAVHATASLRPIMDRSLPLHGLRILDCSRVLAGPFATMLLADLGADVVKLEPPAGDESRGWGPPWWGAPEDRRSAYFGSVNRNKRSIVVDLRTDAGRELLDRLADGADLLIHNARPSSAARLGLDAERLRAAHPGLAVAVVGGFSGRDRELPAYDLLAQAMSGLMSVTGEADGPPQKAGVALLDLLAGLEVAVGALAVLLGKARGGCIEPPAVEVSLMEASVAALTNVLANQLATGEEPRRWGNAHPNIVPYQSFATRDGYLAIAVGNDAQFARLLEVLGLDAEGRYATNAERVAARDELVPWLSAAIEGAAATSWWRRCAPRTCRPVRWPAWARRCATWKRPTAATGCRRRRRCASPPTRSGSTGRALRSAARHPSWRSTRTSC